MCSLKVSSSQFSSCCWITTNFHFYLMALLISNYNLIIVNANQWDHAVDLNDDYRLLWTINNQDITFEVQVRTLGYIGFGFSPDGNLSGSDIAIGWVDKGQAHFQDRHVNSDGGAEPVLDASQDYILLLGYENSTHTVFRFKRKLDTCDEAYDIPITNDTMRIVYMYHKNEPYRGSVIPGTLPNPLEAFKEYRPLYLTQKFQPKQPQHNDYRSRILELRNEDVRLPDGDDTLFWCKMFKFDDINRKHHLIQYEPIIDSKSSRQYLQQIILYECQGNGIELEQFSRERGRECQKPYNLPLECNSIVAAWSRGSEGFTFPEEAGYPLETRQARYFLMETHYVNTKSNPKEANYRRQDVDNSGLRIYFTNNLRTHDAGVLSVGLDPNWRHIIPPGQKRVVSEGQCIEDCTGYAFPRQGISIFAVMMRTHMIGKQIRFRQIRHNTELPNIAADNNIDSNYQNYRTLPVPVHSIPGDRLIAECIYDSSSRTAITLGGLTTREESCTILSLYYPRQKKLTTCHSLPSLPTVLHSLGIEELAMGSNPVLISSPPELAGMTLESRLLTYDWKNQFDKFQEATIRGSFKPICWSAKNHLVPGTEYLEGSSLNISYVPQLPQQCVSRRSQVTVPAIQLPPYHPEENDISFNIDSTTLEATSTSKSKVSRSPWTQSMGFSSAYNYSNNSQNLIKILMLSIVSQSYLWYNTFIFLLYRLLS